ncbi:hypothetical protein [Pseudomonas sp. NFX5]|uniref:hypothetical protein n=1 Tax=Pseudomonas sp. NFX5 TaxID=2816961 RepID=UPI003B8E96D1
MTYNAYLTNVDLCIRELKLLLHAINTHLAALENHIKSQDQKIAKIMKTSKKKYNGSAIQKIITRFEVAEAMDFHNLSVFHTKQMILKILEEMLLLIITLESTYQDHETKLLLRKKSKNHYPSSSHEILKIKRLVRQKIIQCRSIK